jgi:cyanophycin synthetase
MGINQMRFQATIHMQTSSIAVDIACKGTYQKMLDMASIPVASGSICVNEDDLAETIKKLATNRVKTIGWKSRKELIS